MGGMRIGRDTAPPALTACTTDQLLEWARVYAEQVKQGDHGHVHDFARVFKELDERLLASGQLPADWKVD